MTGGCGPSIVGFAAFPFYFCPRKPRFLETTAQQKQKRAADSCVRCCTASLHRRTYWTQREITTLQLRQNSDCKEGRRRDSGDWAHAPTRPDMGSSQSQLTAEELRDYRELTFLTKKEILHAFKRFKGIAVGEVLADKHARIPVKYIEQMPEFKCNPFRDRLLRVFSSCKDERMSFEDFLDLLSVLCEDAPIDVKAEYAFQIFDMDDDGVLGEDDLAEVIKRLTSWDSGCRLETPDVQRLIEQVLAEADLDRSGHMSLMEFQHCMLKNPDFASSFSLRL